MKRISSSRQTIHDQVVEKVAQIWRKEPGYEVFTNPGSEKNMSLNGRLYPDVIVVKRGTRTVVCIAEVETEESVTADEATAQWRPYARAAPLFLYVPSTSCRKAERLVLQYKVPVKRILGWDLSRGFTAQGCDEL